VTLRARESPGDAGRLASRAGSVGSVAPLLFAALALLFAGCTTVGGSDRNLEAASFQTLEYYPYLVKGYQGTYPHRTVIVLMPDDVRTPKPSDDAAATNRPSIGVTIDRDDTIIHRLHSDPLAPLVQNAIARSAEEAGFHTVTAAAGRYDRKHTNGADYVLAAKIVRCWVKKRRGAGKRHDPLWSTEADFALQVTIYKPPFKVPFWAGASSSTYDDPPIFSSGLGPDDEVGIYDDPGQVLSVALTRAVAGIFEHRDLQELVFEDHIHSH
jgi:hypothetical protein